MRSSPPRRSEAGEGVAIRAALESGAAAVLAPPDADALASYAALTGGALAAEDVAKPDGGYAMLERLDFARDARRIRRCRDARFFSCTSGNTGAPRRRRRSQRGAVVAAFDSGAPVAEFRLGRGSAAVFFSGWATAGQRPGAVVEVSAADLRRAARARASRPASPPLAVGDALRWATISPAARSADQMARRSSGSLAIPEWLSTCPASGRWAKAMQRAPSPPTLDPAEGKTAPMPPARLEEFGAKLSGAESGVAPPNPIPPIRSRKPPSPPRQGNASGAGSPSPCFSSCSSRALSF
ncbi:MAG: hypothetical protein R3F11_32765 [Verrucomicrobiales bacterium]